MSDAMIYFLLAIFNIECPTEKKTVMYNKVLSLEILHREARERDEAGRRKCGLLSGCSQAHKSMMTST